MAIARLNTLPQLLCSFDRCRYNAASPTNSHFVPPSEQNSEWLTRKRLIDPKLKLEILDRQKAGDVISYMQMCTAVG
jgi:hypothetical protein